MICNFFPKHVKNQHFWNLCEAICHQRNKLNPKPQRTLNLGCIFSFHKTEIAFIHNDRANSIYDSFIHSIAHKFSQREHWKELSILVLPGHGTPHNDLLKFCFCNSTDLPRQNVLWNSWIVQNWRYILFRYLLFCKTPAI
jgi:hypothetical protein